MQHKIVYVFKSSKKDRCYLYLNRKDGFDDLPKALKEAFGDPVFLLMFSTAKRQSIPKVELGVLLDALKDKGFFLRIDQVKEENLLDEERKRKGLSPLAELKETLGDRHQLI